MLSGLWSAALGVTPNHLLKLLRQKPSPLFLNDRDRIFIEHVLSLLLPSALSSRRSPRPLPARWAHVIIASEALPWGRPLLARALPVPRIVGFVVMKFFVASTGTSWGEVVAVAVIVRRALRIAPRGR